MDSSSDGRPAWVLSHAKRVTTKIGKNSEQHVIAAIRRLGTDKNCPAKIHDRTMFIGSKKTYSPKIKKATTDTKMQGTANQNGAGIDLISPN